MGTTASSNAPPTRFLSPSNGQTRPSLDNFFYCGTVCHYWAPIPIYPAVSHANAARDPSRLERRLPRLSWAGRSLKQCSFRNRLRAARCTPDVPRQHVMRAESPVALSIWPRAQLLFRGHLGRRLLLRSVHPWTDTCKLARTRLFRFFPPSSLGRLADNTTTRHQTPPLSRSSDNHRTILFVSGCEGPSIAVLRASRRCSARNPK